jgi:hypothetical protein
MNYAKEVGMSLRKQIMSVLLLCCLLPAAVAAAQEQNPPQKRLLIVEADPSNMPSLTIRMGLFDEQGQPIGNLEAGDVAVSIGGKPLTTLPKLLLEPRAPAVAIVADFSAMMNDQSVPGQTRVSSLVQQIRELLAKLPDDAPASLITFGAQPKVELDWGTDQSRVLSTLNTLATQALPQAAQNTPYPLTEAAGLGLEQFAKPDKLIAGRPRALFIYAAGAPGQAVDSMALQAVIGGKPLNQPAITFVGLGGDAAGQFISVPGNPASLQQAANALPNAAFRPFFSANPSQIQLLSNDLDTRYRAVVNTGQIYTLSFDAAALAPGVQTISITARGATATADIHIPVMPPKIALRPPPLLQPGAQVYVDVLYSPRPIKQVEYFLNGRSIGVSDTAPSFARTIDRAQLEGAVDSTKPYELSAVATDVDGQQSARESVQVPPGQQPAQPQPTPLVEQSPSQNWPIVALAGLALVLAIAAIAFMTLKINRIGKGADAVSTPGEQPPRNPFDDRTRAVPPPSASGTVPVRGTTKLRVTVLAGHTDRKYQLPPGQEWTVGRESTNPVWIDSDRVSKKHARLELLNGGVQITDLGSLNGTYLGENKRPLAPDQPERIGFGEVFWIGPDIKLKVEQR